VEDDQTVNLHLSNPTGGATLNPQLVDAVLTIQDDDLRSLNEPDKAYVDKVFTVGGFYATSYEHYYDFVSKAYRRYLNREADDAGRAFWIAALQAGHFPDPTVGPATEQRVESFFVGSPEYISFRYHDSQRAWIIGLYRDLLRRPSDPSEAEIQNWLNLLATGTSTDQVAFAFANSPE